MLNIIHWFESGKLQLNKLVQINFYDYLELSFSFLILIVLFFEFNELLISYWNLN